MRNLKLISAILVGALYPNVVHVMTPQSKFNQSSTGKHCVLFISRSVFFFKVKYFPIFGPEPS